MLVVTENGVQVLLKQKSIPKIIWRNWLIIIFLAVLNGILGFGLNVYSANVALCLNPIIIVIASGLETYRKHNQPTILSGGDLLLSPKTFKHTFLGKTTQYQLTQHDTIERQGDSLNIFNAHHKKLYQIQGFSEPKQLEVAQAVLSGKQIQTQAKTIKMQSN